jgi:predicted site-specific integrase-resolvase
MLVMSEIIFAICETKHIEVVIINQGKERSFEEELARDILEIVTVFSARMYGARSHKNKKLIEGVTKAVADLHRFLRTVGLLRRNKKNILRCNKIFSY